MHLHNDYMDEPVVWIWTHLEHILYELPRDHFPFAVSMYEFLWIFWSLDEICLRSEFTFPRLNRLTIRAYSIKLKLFHQK